MAYMNKQLKDELVAEVKKVLPKDWKATFAIRNYSTIVCTIRKAPFTMVEALGTDREYQSINVYNIDKHLVNPEIAATLKKIVDALNSKNHDDSDVYIDYHDVGYYVDLSFGDYKKPFESTK